MKKNTFYLIFGCIALALLFIFWYSVELHTPLLIEIAFITRNRSRVPGKDKGDRCY